MSNTKQATLPSNVVETFDRKFDDLNDAVRSLGGVIGHLQELMTHIGMPLPEPLAECGEKLSEPTLLSTLSKSPADIRLKVSTMHDLLNTITNELT